MKRGLPLYEGDGYIRDGLADLSYQPEVTETADSTDERVSLAELTRIDREARRLRSAVVGGLLARFVHWMNDIPHRAHRRWLERTLGQATDLPDLERRMRQLERGDRRAGQPG